MLISEMKTLVLFAVLLVSNGLGAPVSELHELDKRRESTPEILNLEHELKKAAGEDKQYFSANEARPDPQIDGLADQEKTETDLSDTHKPAHPVNEAGFVREEDMGAKPGSNEDVEPQGSPTYLQMWNMFRQHPDYLEDVLQDYMNQDVEEQDEARESQGVNRDTLGDTDMMAAGYNPSQDETYMPSEADGISNAPLAEYFASANQRSRLGKAEEVHDESDSEVHDDYDDDGEDENEHDEGNKVYENDGDETIYDDGDNNDQSDEDEEGDLADNNGENEDDNESNELDDVDEMDKLYSVNPNQSIKPWHGVGDLAVPPPLNM